MQCRACCICALDTIIRIAHSYLTPTRLDHTLQYTQRPRCSLDTSSSSWIVFNAWGSFTAMWCDHVPVYRVDINQKKCSYVMYKTVYSTLVWDLQLKVFTVTYGAWQRITDPDHQKKMKAEQCFFSFWLAWGHWKLHLATLTQADTQHYDRSGSTPFSGGSTNSLLISSAPPQQLSP